MKTFSNLCIVLNILECIGKHSCFLRIQMNAYVIQTFLCFFMDFTILEWLKHLQMRIHVCHVWFILWIYGRTGRKAWTHSLPCLRFMTWKASRIHHRIWKKCIENCYDTNIKKIVTIQTCTSFAFWECFLPKAIIACDTIAYHVYFGNPVLGGHGSCW